MDIVQKPNAKQCSNCKVYISEANFDLHEARCKRLTLCDICHCPFPKAELKQHYQNEHAPEFCDLCGEELPRDKLDDHKMLWPSSFLMKARASSRNVERIQFQVDNEKETSCPKVRVVCDFCELEILRSKYEEHQNVCGSRTDLCKLCNQRVMLKDMNKHEEAMCGHMKSEYTMNSHDPMRMRFEGGEGDVDDVNWSSEGLPLARGGDLSRPSNFFPLQAHQPYIPSLSHSTGHDTHADNTVCVDSQWLASVTDVCGQDSMDRVLAQNLQAMEEYGGGGGSANLCSSDHGSKRDVESFRPDDGCSEHLVQRRNVHEGHSQGLAALSVRYDPDKNSSYHRRDDFIPPLPQRGLSQEELERIETEKKDAELAWMTHERDNAYSWHGDESSKITVGGSNVGEESDAEMARMIHERDMYAQRNQRKDGYSTDRILNGSEYYANETTSSGNHNPRLSYTRYGSRRASAEENESELGRVLRSSTTKSQINRNLERGNSVGRVREDDDAEMARRIHERDLAYAMKNSRPDGRESFGWGSTEDTELLDGSHNRGTSHYDKREVGTLESSDSMLARAIARRERDYVKEVEMDRMLAKQIQEVEEGTFNNTRDDFEVARRIQMEQDFGASSSASHTHMEGYNHGVLKNEQPRSKSPAAELESPRGEGEVPCQYCYSLFPFKMIMEHQERCMSKQLHSSIHLSGCHEDMVLEEEAVQGVSNTPVNRMDERASEKCEHCNAMMTVDVLRVHQVTCESNPNSHLRNAYLHRTPRQSDESLLAMPTQHQPTLAVGAVNLNDKGPCEVCGELVPIDALVRHEGTCRARGMTVASSSAPVSMVMSVQHEQVGGANSTGDALAAASNPRTKQGVPSHTSHQHSTTTRRQATESLGIVGRSVDTVRTTAGVCGNDRTKKTSQPSKQAVIYESNSSIQTLPEVACTRKTLYHQSTGSNLAPPGGGLTRKTLHQQNSGSSLTPEGALTKKTSCQWSSGSSQILPEVALTRKTLYQPGKERAKADGDGSRRPHVLQREKKHEQ